MFFIEMETTKKLNWFFFKYAENTEIIFGLEIRTIFFNWMTLYSSSCWTGSMFFTVWLGYFYRLHLSYIFLEQVSLEAGMLQPLCMGQFYSAPAADTVVQQLLPSPEAAPLPEPPDPKMCK